MSHSNRHQYFPLNKDSKPLSGQRLARVIAKAAKDGSYNENLKESLCVSVPKLSVDAIEPHIDSLVPHIVAWMESVQNEIISEKRKESGCTEISDEDISIANCILWLESESKGNRVTSDYLKEWFKESYSLQAAEFISLVCKFPSDMNLLTPEQVEVVETKTNVLASMFAGFASGKYSPDIPKCKAMIKFGEYLGSVADNRMSLYLEKSAKILDEKTKELSMDALGF